MIYLLVPTRMELDAFGAHIEDSVQVKAGMRAGIEGRISGKSARVVIAGMGQTNTAQALTAMLESGRPGLVIMAGCAGAYAGSSLKVGDVAAASEEIYADSGILTPEGFKGIEETGFPLVESSGVAYFSRFPLSGDYNRIVENACPGIRIGLFLTVSTVSGTAKRGKELFSRYGALCENMEGAAAAQVCLLYGVPFVEIRGVSNMVEDRNRDRWDIDKAMKNCAMAVAAFIERLEL